MERGKEAARSRWPDGHTTICPQKNVQALAEWGPGRRCEWDFTGKSAAWLLPLQFSY